jgi:[protein-PII] uridylyltransferase
VSSRTKLARRPKEEFDRSLDAITRLHRRGAGGLEVGLALTQRMDTLIRIVHEQAVNPGDGTLTIVALGGYGRKELCFFSDTDIMFLIDGDSYHSEATPVVQRILHELLDCGLDVGHSFRTVDECVSLFASDFKSWNSLLESRYVCGNSNTFARLRSSMAIQINGDRTHDYLKRLIAAMEDRHREYGTSTKRLEPNIKNSAGGLRDLHASLWLMIGSGSFTLQWGPRSTALSSLFASPAMQKLFSRRFLAEARRALDFLLHARNEMHLLSKSLHDWLEFALQRQVAEGLGYRPSSTRTSVERFMQEYYVATRAVAQLTRRIINWAQEQYLTPSNSTIVTLLDRHFALNGNRVEFRHSPAHVSSGGALTAFLHANAQGAIFSHQLEDVLTRGAARFKPLRSISETQILRELLNRQSGVWEALQRMNDLGLLARWIPEWKEMVAFFQHNVYHYYTADEHTLMVVACAERLESANDSFGRVFQRLPRRDTLYLACLLHDIAKPKRIGDHEITGVEMARTILKRLRYEDVMEDVLFLIRNHLIMEQVAFRRNLGDTQTIIDFASRFKNTRQLDYLYLLTYADLNAVNKNVWTDWKGMLLFELYQRTYEVLDRKLTSAEVEKAELVRYETAARKLVRKLAPSLPRETTRKHLEELDSPAYLSSFDAQEIAEHIRHIGSGECTSTIFTQKSDYTEITIIAQDAPFVLSRFCGVLTANDANIFDAQIFTRGDGVIIDKFRVTDFIAKTTLNEQQCTNIRNELNDVLSGTTDILHLLNRHRMKWKRKTRPPNPNVRVDVEFEDHPKYTIIDVFAPDMLGFLYRVTETMSKLGLNISFAKIATRVDGIVDSFYVTDQTGSRIEELGRREFVKQEVLGTISELTQSELVPRSIK